MRVPSLIKKISLLFAKEEHSPEVSEARAEMPLSPQTTSPQSAPSSPQPRTKPTPLQAHSETPRPPRARALSTAPPIESIREQTELLLGQIGRTAKDFVAYAEQNKFSDLSAIATQEVLTRHDVIALMLGYKLTGVAYHRLQPNPSREVLRTVRVAMVSMLLKAARDHAHLQARSKVKPGVNVQTLSLEAAEEHVKSADLEVLSVVENHRSGGTYSLAKFYLGLAPTFGDATVTEQLSERFEKTLLRLLVQVEAAVGKGTTAQASA